MTGGIHYGVTPDRGGPTIQKWSGTAGSFPAMRMNETQSYTFRTSGKVAGDAITTTVGCLKDGVVIHEYPEGESPCDVCGNQEEN